MISIDFETRSVVDLKKTGVYPYARHPSTDIWCAAYAFDAEDEIHVWCPGQPLDSRLVRAVAAGRELHAWNAQFERVIWREIMRRYGWPIPEPEQWHCTMARAANYGLPLHLGEAAKVLGVEQQKDDEGHRLMLRMSKPRRIVEGKPIWWDVPEKRLLLYAYCQQDVRTERAIAARLRALTERERKLYLLDQTINDRGVYIDRELAVAARECVGIATGSANRKLAEVTDGAARSVTAVADITGWLRGRGVQCPGIAKAHVRDMLAASPAPEVAEVLTLRSDAAKSSVAKLDSMLAYASDNGRMRGLLAYHGAATGRWAGRGPQPQNFPRGEVRGVTDYIPFVMERAVEALDLCEPPLRVISSMLRSIICAAPGRRLMAGDYAAIEARVLAWLAGHDELLTAFRNGEDVYKKLASSIYNVPVGKVDKAQRWMGKTATLGLGYQMGSTKFVASCATNGVSITEEFGVEVVRKYRFANTPIVKLWEALNSAALRAMHEPGVRVELHTCAVTFQYHDGWLFLRLPSHRTLKYAQPLLTEQMTPWGEQRLTVSFMGFNSVTHQWQRTALYGGLLAENVTQAVARDLLADAMLDLEASRYSIILTVHDEIVCEVPLDTPQNLEEFTQLMTRVPSWASGCPVAVEAWEGERYRK